jgi:hypothetical protein
MTKGQGVGIKDFCVPLWPLWSCASVWSLLPASDNA